MRKRSAGILMYRRTGRELEVLLVHPGGPYWARKDAGAWTIPKGEYRDDEEAFAAAVREFAEETGCEPAGDFLPLGDIRQKGGKTVSAWAVEGAFDCAALVSNTFELQWPPRSGKMATFPEVDRAEWFDLRQARLKILPSQSTFLDRLVAAVEGVAA
jgi:predicted NUDIX family NTP pyrophosphohydrolase